MAANVSYWQRPLGSLTPSALRSATLPKAILRLLLLSFRASIVGSAGTSFRSLGMLHLWPSVPLSGITVTKAREAHPLGYDLLSPCLGLSLLFRVACRIGQARLVH